MKHKKVGRKFGRVRNQRKAFLNGLLGNLIEKERIITTEARAKETKRLIDGIINKAKEARKDKSRKVAILRELEKDLSVPTVKKLAGDFVDRFESRNSGYSRVIRIERRKSDGSRMSIIEFV